MSVKLMGRVFDLAMKSNRKFVLLALGNYADDEGRNVFPSVNTISNKTGLSERTVGRSLSEFRKHGVIIRYKFRKGKRGRIPVYQIQIDRAESVYGLVDDNPAAVAWSREDSDVSAVDGGGSKAATTAGSKNGNPANRDRLPATGDMTLCHSLAENPLGPVSKNRKDSPPLPPSLKNDDLTEAVQAFNKVALQIGLPVVQNFSDTRRRKLRRRLAECGGLEGWSAALAKVEASTFLTGGGREGWRADFDFMLQAKSFTKILEGAYDDNPRRDGGSSEIQAAFDRMDSRERGKR